VSVMKVPCFYRHDWTGMVFTIILMEKIKLSREVIMIVLKLSDDEADRLEAALKRFLIELEREIAATDSQDYRIDLEKTEQVLKDVSGRLKRTA